MIVHDGLAGDDARGVAGARESENFGGRTFRIARDASRACFQHAEIRHAPFGCVAADEHDTIALLDSLAGEKTGDPGSELAEIRVGILLLPAVAFDAHRHARRVTL